MGYYAVNLAKLFFKFALFYFSQGGLHFFKQHVFIIDLLPV